MSKIELNEDHARIKKFIETGEPIELHKGKLAFLILQWCAVIAIGTVLLIGLLTPEKIQILFLIFLISGLLTFNVHFWVILTLFIVMASTVAFLAALAVNNLLRKHGSGLIKFSIIFITIVFWILLLSFSIIMYIYTLSTYVFWVLIFPLIFTIAMVISFTKGKQALRRAGIILKLTGQIVHEERELIVPAILKIFLIGILTFFLGIIDLYIMTWIYPMISEPVLVWVLGIIIFFIESFYIIFNINMFTAISYAISYIWYRNKDPVLRDGFAVALYQMGDIAIFSILSAIIEIIKAILRSLSKRKGTSQSWIPDGFRLAEGIIGSVWYYINYFTLPSIVIEDKPVTKAIKSSAHRLYDNFADVFMKEYGVKLSFSLLTVLMLIIFGSGGGLFGLILYYAYVYPIMGILDYIIMIVLVVVGIILFIAISMIIIRPMLMMYNDIYMAILFGFLIDKENDFKYPVRLPENILNDWKEWFNKHPSITRCPNCNTPVESGVPKCPKCGYTLP